MKAANTNEISRNYLAIRHVAHWGVVQVKFVTRVFLIRLGRPNSQPRPLFELSVEGCDCHLDVRAFRILFAAAFLLILIEKILQFCHPFDWALATPAQAQVRQP